MAGYMRQNRPKKKRMTGPRTLKKGAWNWENGLEDDIWVYDFMEQEDFPPTDSAAIKDFRELAHYTSVDGKPSDFSFYNVPEYRSPNKKNLQLEKGQIPDRPVDQGPEMPFVTAMLEALRRAGCVEDAMADLEKADVVIGLDGLYVLLSWLDGNFQRDMRAKGLHATRTTDAVQIDLFRLLKLSEAPNALFFGSVWQWDRHNLGPNAGQLGTRSYDVSMVERCIGNTGLNGPMSTRVGSQDRHFRILSYTCGDLKMVVRVPILARVPTVDADAFERSDMAVDISSVNRRRQGNLWESDLPTRYAKMQLGDIGMIARGVVDKGTLIDIQELTQEDLCLDRPSIVEDAGILFGRLVRLFKRLKEVAASPGCVDQPLYLQYCEFDLRVISPRFDDEDPEGWTWDAHSDPVVAAPVEA